jgi:UDP-3-O-[3-hydroxymyristoyl] glucosamine N-acyltransferase
MSGMRVREIAERVGGEVVGDGDTLIEGVAGIRYAAAGELSYVSQARYAGDVAKTNASAVMVGRDWNAPAPVVLIKVDSAEKAFAEVAQWFAPDPVSYPPGIHPTAVISPEAVLGPDVHVGPYCVIGPDASVGARSVLVGHNVIAPGASLGEDCLIYPMVTLREYVRVGDRAIFHNGVVIGGDGFGFEADKRGVRTKIPQIGIVEIGNDVEIGANSTVDRARFGKTKIGNGVKIDNLVMVAHNCVIGDHVVLVSQVGVGGSTLVGPHAILAGQVGVAGHLEIGAGAVIGAQSGVTKDIAPKSYSMGFPAISRKQFAENQAGLNRLPQMKKRLAELEARLAALEADRG